MFTSPEFNTYEYTNPNSPKYNPEVPPGSSDQDWDYRIDNPEYLKAKSKLDRDRYDQETLFELNPFFKGNRFKDNQLSDEEEELLNDPIKRDQLLGIAPPDILGMLREDEIPYAFLPGYMEVDNKELRRNFRRSFVANKLSQLPIKERYAWLIQNKEYIEPFLNKYYTNTETQDRIGELLYSLIDNIAQSKNLRDSFVNAPNIPQNEYFSNLQDIRQWLDKHGR